MQFSFETFIAKKQVIDVAEPSEAADRAWEALDLSVVHSEQVICYYAAPGQPVGHMEVIRGPGRESPCYHLKRGVWDEIATNEEELQRLEKILYECLESEGF